MIKGILKLIVFFVIAIGIFAYVYQKYQNNINEYFNGNLKRFFENGIENILPGKGEYADSIKIFIEKKIKKYGTENSSEIKEKMDKLKKELNRFSDKDFIDKEDYLKLKKIFE